ncbi:MBL fold metallo-hydrolase [Gallaecimonas mangrovi]|uniref:MBL fold metallo-hydrolase n=1 Tax=Gallaecimonas mangrovi TaxID=2291597 RepID=UPI000E206703|nr:MBL fold metallo-hydrolase [Gallaecimonas mangrovi]
MHAKWISALLLLVAVSCQPLWAAEEYKIEPVTGGLYRFTAGHYESVFLVTDQGILLTDPLNDKAATWLHKALKSRYPNTPIRYLIYSHNHVDHALGADKLVDPTTVLVSQALAREDMAHTKLPVKLPDLVFNDKASIYLGNTQVTLQYWGTNNGRGSISMLFEPQKVLYVVDWVVLGRMPYKDLKGYDIEGMIHSTKAVLNLDFDRFVGGHGAMGTKADVRHYLGYLEALYDAVRDGMLKGKSLAQLKSEIKLPQYSNLPLYKEWLPLNIEGVYRTLNDSSYFDLRPDIPQG